MRLIDADLLEPDTDYDDGEYWGYSIAQIERAPTINPEPRWIPCSERLPEESGRYLVSVLDGVGRRTTVAPYQPRYKAWTLTGRMAYWKVIAWMPLPEPYKAERRGDPEEKTRVYWCENVRYEIPERREE